MVFCQKIMKTAHYKSQSCFLILCFAQQTVRNTNNFNVQRKAANTHIQKALTHECLPFLLYKWMINILSKLFNRAAMTDRIVDRKISIFESCCKTKMTKFSCSSLSNVRIVNWIVNWISVLDYWSDKTTYFKKLHQSINWENHWQINQ